MVARDFSLHGADASQGQGGAGETVTRGGGGLGARHWSVADGEEAEERCKNGGGGQGRGGGGGGGDSCAGVGVVNLVETRLLNIWVRLGFILCLV